MHQLLEKTTTINSQILRLVESKQWDQILKLTNQRDGYLRRYFELSPLPDSNSTISQVIVEMTNSDQKVTEIISGLKTELIDESLSLKKSHKAIKQYEFAQTR